MAKGTTKDEAQGAPAQQVSVSAETLENYGKQIAELDAKIASASGSDAAGKKAWIENLIAQNQSEVDGYATSIIEQVSELDLPLLVGLVTRLEERLKADLAPKVETYVNEEYPKTKTTEDAEALRNTRKELLVQFKALRAVLDSFGIANAHVPDPKSRGGGRPAGSGGGGGAGSKSGANKEGYRYFIDGNMETGAGRRPRSQNSFSSVAFYATDNVPAKLAVSNGASEEDAKKLPKKWGAKELKDFVVKETGGEFGSLDTWTVTLPNGKTVSARRFTDQDKVELGIVEDANETGNGQGETPPETTNVEDTVGAAV